MYAGDLGASALRIGDLAASRVYRGDGLAWAAFSPSGMSKSADAAVAMSWTTVSGWVADTSGYPGSQVSGSALVVRGFGDFALSVNLVVANSTFISLGLEARILVNGVAAVLGTEYSVPAAASATIAISGERTVGAGDLVSVQVRATQSATDLKVKSGAATWVRITRP